MPDRPVNPSRPIINGGDRPNFITGGDRPIINNGGNTNVNRPTWINNRPVIGGGGNNSNNVNIGNINQINGYRPSTSNPWGTYHGGAWAGYYAGWHNGWHSGYWGSGNGNWFAAGVATGWLLTPRVGAYTYANPFYAAPAEPVPAYDYSQPIVTAPPVQPLVSPATDVPVDVPAAPAPEPAQPVARSAQEEAGPDVSKLSEEDAQQLQQEVEDTVKDARSLFKAGAYPSSLGEIEKAISKLPNDPNLHEFRALVLFARGDVLKNDYKNAAAAVYSVLASGPGWNWETLSKLYPDTKVYTKQLRALETHFKDNPTAAEDAFLLAYHYLTLGEKDSAVAKLEAMQKLVPGDELSKKILDFLKNPPPPPAADADKPKPGS